MTDDFSLIENYIGESDWRVKENANMSYSLQGLNFHISSEIVSSYWLNKIYNSDIKNAHKNGDFHIHDLGILGVYCVGWDLRDLLLSGFTGAVGKIQSAPPKHFSVALGQIVNFLYSLQGEAAGAQALSNFDTYLAPFIRYDNLSKAQVKQFLQGFVYNLNVPTRVGFQTPFTNISLDLKVPDFLKDEAVIIGGELKNKTYKEFQEEMDIFNECLAKVMIEGDASGRVFTFPIPTYNITRDFDFDDSRYNSIWEMTAKYGIPYFSNFINTDLRPDDVRSMCCRLRIDNRELKKRGGGLFGSNPLTGSVGVVTINMPRIGYNSKNEMEFLEQLEYLMDKARDSLEIKRNILEDLTQKGLYPYARFYLRDIKSRFGKYWKNHFSTIGLIGMNECLWNFKQTDIASNDGQAFAIKVMDFMREKLAKYQEETGNIYNLEATPGEGTSYRLARLDKERYPQIITANGIAKDVENPYYTNSTHLPVNYTTDIFEVLKLQDEIQTKYTGGTVIHTFLGESSPNIDSVKLLVKRIAYNFKLPYFTLTPTFSICKEHGFISGKHYYCPKCESNNVITKCEVYSRIVGYLRPVDQWNNGKKEEFKMRLTYDEAIKCESVDSKSKA